MGAAPGQLALERVLEFAAAAQPRRDVAPVEAEQGPQLVALVVPEAALMRLEVLQGLEVSAWCWRSPASSVLTSPSSVRHSCSTS